MAKTRRIPKTLGTSPVDAEVALASTSPQVGKPENVRPLTDDNVVLPRTLFGAHEVAISLPDGVLGAAVQPTAASLVQAARDAGDPGWLSAMSKATRAAIAASLRAIPEPAGPTVHTFDLATRLDDTTWVAVANDRVATLTVTKDGRLLTDDPTGHAFSSALTDYARGELVARSRLSVSVRAVGDFGPPWDRAHQPSLAIREVLRLLVVDAGLSVGNAAGTVALLPGEAREVQLTTERVVEASGKRTGDFLDKATEEASTEFQREFNSKDSLNDQRSSKVTWGLNATVAPQTSTSGGERQRTVSNLAERTVKTVEKLATKRTSEASVRVTMEFQSKLSESVKDFRKATLSNPTKQCVTFVYHRLNRRYVILVDLIGVEIAFSGSSPASRPAPVAPTPLGWEEIEGWASSPAQATRLVAAIAGAQRTSESSLALPPTTLTSLGRRVSQWRSAVSTASRTQSSPRLRRRRMNAVP